MQGHVCTEIYVFDYIYDFGCQSIKRTVCDTFWIILEVTCKSYLKNPGQLQITCWVLQVGCDGVCTTYNSIIIGIVSIFYQVWKTRGSKLLQYCH